MIKLDNYQIERLDKYNFKLEKNSINRNGNHKVELVGYYPSMINSVKSIIRHKTEDNLDVTTLEDFLNKYERISKETLSTLSAIV